MSNIVCGTGHRPKYCPCKYNTKHPWLLSLKERIREAIQPFDAVITGMAIGFDTWLAQVAIEESKPVLCYIPFEGQQDAWPSDSRKEYDRILSLSAERKIICPTYSNQAFIIRDHAMVDDSNEVLALWSGIESGGTYETVTYAQKLGKNIQNLWVD